MPRNKILLVDNEVENLRLYEISFRRAGFIPTIATDGADALKKIELLQPDLIVAEVNLPNMDGYEFCAEVKNDPRFRSIPFLFLTKEKSIENKVMGLELGADDYLVKPIFIKELITRAKMLVDRRDREGMRVNGQKSLSGVLGEMEIVDLIQIMEMGVKSGIINLVFEGGEEGKLYFRRGKIIKIQFLSFEGNKAFFRILNRSKGSFNVDFVEPEVEDNIEMTTHEIVMEGMRCVDEWRGISEGMPQLDSVLAVNSELILGSDPDEEILSGTSNILGEFDGRRTIWEVIDRVNETDLEVLKKISHLYFEGYLIPVTKIEKEGVAVQPEAEESPAPAAEPSQAEPVETGPSQDFSIEHIFLEEAPAKAGPIAGQEPAPAIISGPAPASTPTKKRTLAEIEKESPPKPKTEPVSEKPKELEIEVDFFSEGEESSSSLPPKKPAAAPPAAPPVETKIEFEVPVPAASPAEEKAKVEIAPEIKEEVKEVKEVKPRRKPISDEEMWFLPPEEAAQASIVKKAEPKPISAKFPSPKVSPPPSKAVEPKPEKTPAGKTPAPEAAPSETPAPAKDKKTPAPDRRVQLSPTLIAGGVAAVVALVVVAVLMIMVVKKNRVQKAPVPAAVQVARVPEKPGDSPPVPTPQTERKSGGGETVTIPAKVVAQPSSPAPEKPQKESPVAKPPAPSREKPAAAPVETAVAPKPKEKPAAPAPELIAAKPKAETKPAPAAPVASAPVESAPVNKIDPAESKTHVLKGKVLYLKGDKKGAAAEFTLAVSLNPQSPEAQFNLGVALHETGQVAEAVKALQATVELNPRNPEAFRILGILYQKLGDQKNSSVCFQKYLSLLSE